MLEEATRLTKAQQEFQDTDGPIAEGDNEEGVRGGVGGDSAGDGTGLRSYQIEV